MKKNGFTVVDTKQITSEDLSSEKYHPQSTGHPSEEAWDLLTPLIIKNAKLDN